MANNLKLTVNNVIGKLHDAAVEASLKAANSWKNKLKNLFSFGGASDDSLIFNNAFATKNKHSEWLGPNKNYYIEFIRSGFFNKSKLDTVMKEYMRWFAGIDDFKLEDSQVQKFKYGWGVKVWRVYYDMIVEKKSPLSNNENPYVKNAKNQPNKNNQQNRRNKNTQQNQNQNPFGKDAGEDNSSDDPSLSGGRATRPNESIEESLSESIEFIIKGPPTHDQIVAEKAKENPYLKMVLNS